MPTALTDPSRDSHQPDKQYTRVLAIGDRKARDFEFNEAQQIQEERRRRALSVLFRHGAIVREAGGTIGAAQQGVKTANMLATSLGAYTGFDTQLYTITVDTGGAAGTAVLSVKSNGSDSNEGQGFTIQTDASDPLDGTYTYQVGTMGVMVSFTKQGADFAAGDTWTIPVAAGRQLPQVSGNDITPPQVEIAFHGDIYLVPSATLTYPSATSGRDTVYVEVLTSKVDSNDDANLLDPLSPDPVAKRLKVTASFVDHDTSGETLPTGAIAREVFAAYSWDRATDAVTRAYTHPLRVPLDQLPGQIDSTALARIEWNEELKGLLAERDHESWGSRVIEGLGVSESTNTAPSGKILLAIDPGVARVNGLRVTKEQAQEIQIDAGTDTGSVVGELHTYSSGTDTYALNKSPALVGTDGFPIKQVVQLTAFNVAKSANITRGATPDTSDGPLPATPVSQINQVTNATIRSVSGQTINPTEQTTLAAQASPGATSITVADGSLFDDPGGSGTRELTLSPGQAEQETITYTDVSGNTVSGIPASGTGSITNTHASGNAVRQTNFQQSGDYIDWSPKGKEPDSSTSYDVAYEASQQLTEGATSDFELIDDDGDGALDSVRFTAGGVKPVDQSSFSVDYDYYLKRRDVVYLKQDGTFGVSRGIPSETPTAVAPAGKFLALAEVRVPPLGSTVKTKIIETRVEKVTVAELNRALREIESIKYDLAQQRLIDQVMARDPGFRVADADAFINDFKIDHGFSRPGGAGGNDDGTQVTEDIGFNIFGEFESRGGGHLTLPRTAETLSLTPNTSLTPGGETAAHLLDSWLCLPFTEVVAIDQDQWSEPRNINSFLVYSPPEPRIILSPAEDYWVDTQDQYEIVLRGVTYRVSREVWLEAQATGRLPSALGGRRARFDRLLEQIESVDALFMRQIPVVIEGRYFVSGQGIQEEVSAAFDGKSVSLTPLGGTQAGSNPGTVLTAADQYTTGSNPQLLRRGGDFKAQFTVPANVPVGRRTLVCIGNLGSQASADFVSFGIERTVHNILLATILRSPLAQTWAFSSDTVLSSISVPFAAKGQPADDPMILEIREVVSPGGYPGPRFFEQVPKASDDLQTGPSNTNNFAFPDLVFQPASTFYAAVFRNVGSGYQVYTATMGRMGHNPQALIDYNPNSRQDEADRRFWGVVLDSLNNDYWESPDPDAPGSTIALRYKLFRADFDLSEAVIYYDQLTFSSAVGYLFLTADQFLPEGTTAIWEVSYDGLAIGAGGKQWVRIEPYRELTLSVPKTVFDLRCRLSTSNSRVSPFIHQRNAALYGSMSKAVGEYIQKPITTIPDIVSATLYCEVSLPPDTTLTLYMSNGEDGNGYPIWEQATLDSTQTQTLPDGWEARAYTVTFNNSNPSKVTKNKIRARVKLTADAQKLPNENIPSPLVRNFGWTVKEV